MTKEAVILDTNAVLRFLTNDDPARSAITAAVLGKEDCIVPVEVVAETVYNLEKVYSHTRQHIANEIKDFISIKENLVAGEHIVRFGCNLFASTKLDFIDCLLAAYAKVNGNCVFTFDTVLKKHLANKAYQ